MSPIFRLSGPLPGMSTSSSTDPQLQRSKAWMLRSKVGGPATADNQWIAEFLANTKENALSVDFVSTHHYPTDAFGKPGADTETQLQNMPRGMMKEQAAKARAETGDLPLYYTEWNISSNPRDPLHDGPFAAAFVTKIIMEAHGLVQGYSFWTFSDIF